MKLRWKDLAVAALMGAGGLVILAALARAMRQVTRERQRENERKLKELATTVNALQARQVELGRSPAAPAQETEVAQLPPAAVTEAAPAQETEVAQLPPAAVTEAAPAQETEVAQLPLTAVTEAAREPDVEVAQFPPAAVIEAALTPDKVKPETVAALTAAAAAFLNKKARIRSANLAPAAQDSAGAWAQQGRVIVLGSHNFRPRE